MSKIERLREEAMEQVRFTESLGVNAAMYQPEASPSGSGPN